MGYAVAQSCFGDAAEAAAAYCSNVTGATGAGFVSCSAPVVVGQQLTYTLNIESAEGTTSRQVTVNLPACEPYDWSFYGPVLGGFGLTLVLIVCARMVYRPFNRRETL